MSAPVNRQADSQTTEHRQIPSRVQRAHPTLVFQGDHIQPLMQAVLDAPVAAFIVEPRGGIVGLRLMSGQQEELLEGGGRLAGIINRLLQFRGLLGERKADLLGADGKTRDGTGFRTALIQLRALRQIRR